MPVGCGWASQLTHPAWLPASLPAPRLAAPSSQGAAATDPLYSAYHYSHPPLAERLAALDAAGQKKEQ